MPMAANTKITKLIKKLMSYLRSRHQKKEAADLGAYTRSQLTEALITLDGKAFSFDGWEFYRPIYDAGHVEMLLKCGRQVAKTTTGGNMMLTDSISMQHFKTLFVSPTQAQTARFSHSRLQKTINHSKEIRENFTSTTIPMNVGMKYFTNGSEVHLSYATDDPDRTRGVSADRIMWDEIQDIVYAGVVPVVNEVISESDYGWITYAGTPKSMENTIEFLWQQSSQDEWLMKCTKCNKYNYVISEASIGKTGVICLKCGGKLNPRVGMWYPTNPGAYVKGFHIPQLIMPANNEKQQRWDRILHKFDNYPDAQFKNEVLGVSDAIGTRLVSQDDLYALCRDYPLSAIPDPSIFKHVSKISAGIDWSGGGSSQFASRTVLHIWGQLPSGKLKTLYYKIFPTSNPVEDVRQIIELCNVYRVDIACGDAGGGAVANAMLAEGLGAHRVVQVQYGSTSKFMAWNNSDRYITDRTAAIDSTMMAYKNGEVIFGRQSQMETAIKDILSEFEETTMNGKGRRQWNHYPAVPDDALHAQVFGRLGMHILTGRAQFYAFNLSNRN
jgi:hypothetical protein